MKVDTEKIEWLLSNSGLTFHKISQEAGVARDTLYKIKDDFKRISYATFDKLVKYVDTHEKEKKWNNMNCKERRKEHVNRKI